MNSKCKVSDYDSDSECQKSDSKSEKNGSDSSRSESDTEISSICSEDANNNILPTLIGSTVPRSTFEINLQKKIEE